MKRNKHQKNPVRRLFRVLAITALILIAMWMLLIWYGSRYYRAGESANAAMNGSETVTVLKIPEGYLFDGPGEETALAFYPGALVDAKAYAPMMLKLAEDGIDCVLLEVRYHLSIFDTNRLLPVMKAYPYEKWITAGHSMGGVSASAFAAKHKGEANGETDGEANGGINGRIIGVVLLASYSTKPLDGLKVLSIYGDQDGVLSLSQMEKHRKNLPSDFEELVIPGGNHAGFADYGVQKGDNEALIAPEEQQNAAISLIEDSF